MVEKLVYWRDPVTGLNHGLQPDDPRLKTVGMKRCTCTIPLTTRATRYQCTRCQGAIPHGIEVRFEAEAQPKLDPVVEAVRADLHRRSQLGINKYGTTLHENPGNRRYWLQHAYEEALDLANYLQRLIQEIDGSAAPDGQTHPAAGAGLKHPPNCECNDCWQRMEANSKV